MSLELFKKGPRRILEDSKNPGESWKLSKRKMKIFMQLPGIRSKTYFKKCFSFVPRGFKIDFQDRKRNDPNRKQAGAELGQAQLKLGLGSTSIK